MLVLTRGVEQKIKIGPVTITVVRFRQANPQGRIRVVLGIEAPDDMEISRPDSPNYHEKGTDAARTH
jgi:sRNA-binding carbon storage regulator CsrA